METYFNLGSYSRPITTRSKEAQLWFDRGLNWCYGFNHEEARHCFQKVIDHDPLCAMGYWGLAYAIGPYYNLSWIEYSEAEFKSALKECYRFIQKAQRHAKQATSVEQALISALAVRFPQEKAAMDEALFQQWDDDYAQIMRRVYKEFPHDLDVCALMAEALICRTPWQLWDLAEGAPTKGSDTLEALKIIEDAFAYIDRHQYDPHPGLLHFYIHILEMSPTPEKALPACDTLIQLVPDAGHLVHMPSHIFILCGLYEKSLQANRLATIADNKYVAYDNRLGIYTIYRLHNIHFQIYSALFLGQYEAALRAAEEIVENILPDAFQKANAYLLNYLEGYSGMKAHVLIRFGKWQAIMAEPMPLDPDLFCVTTAMWHYAKGVAYAATGAIEEAEKQQQQLATAVANIPQSREIFNNSCRDILAVAEAMLAGELAYRQEKYDLAFAHLRHTVALYDRLNYTEPWPWMQPPRHALGALLLEQGHIEEAAAVYRADLGLDDSLVRPSQHPNNVWSLHGYAECLQKLDRLDEAEDILIQLEAAKAAATVDITASCFCRQSDPCC